MSGRTGGRMNSERDHEQNIGFHPQNAKELAEYLLPHYAGKDKAKILDACSGSVGVLGNAIKESLIHISKKAKYKLFNKKQKAILLDCIDKEEGRDILEHSQKKYDLIICNPPWKLTESLPIYNHLLDLLEPDGVLIFVINNVFVYQGSDRAEILQYQKYYFLPRWVFKPSGRPLLDCGVMVFHKNGIVPGSAANLRPYIPLKRVDSYKEKIN